MTSPLTDAIEAVGGSAAFLKAMGISSRTLANWRKDGVPDTRWAAVEAVAKGKVTSRDLALERVAKAAPVAAPQPVAPA
jgi:DNA-binding transcriptional regulator YdaS (Cro superfamily)